MFAIFFLYLPNHPCIVLIMGSLCRNEAKVVTDKLSPEQKKQADGFVGGATNVATGVAGTAGGAVKGVLDTAGNTVGLLIIFIGSGLDRGILCGYSTMWFFTNLELAAD